MATPKSLPEADKDIEDITRQLFEIIYNLNDKYAIEAEFALIKLRSASEDIHRIRINQVTQKQK